MIKHFENVGRCFPWKNEERCLDPGPERWRARSPQSRNPMRNVIGGDPSAKRGVALRNRVRLKWRAWRQVEGNLAQFNLTTCTRLYLCFLVPTFN
jgi:hypothetical protein